MSDTTRTVTVDDVTWTYHRAGGSIAARWESSDGRTLYRNGQWFAALDRIAADADALARLRERVAAYDRLARLAQYTSAGTHGHATTLHGCLGIVEALAELAPTTPTTEAPHDER